MDVCQVVVQIRKVTSNIVVEVCWRAVKVIKGEWGAEGVVAGNVRRRKHAVNENRSRWVEVSKTERKLHQVF